MTISPAPAPQLTSEGKTFWRVEQELRCRVRTSVSAPGHAPGDLFLCYRQAKGMLRYPGEQGGVRRYHEEEAGSGLVSLGTLNRLYMALAAGDEAASCAVLDEIRRSCEQSGGMSEIALESLRTSVSSTLIATRMIAASMGKNARRLAMPVK